MDDCYHLHTTDTHKSKKYETLYQKLQLFFEIIRISLNRTIAYFGNIILMINSCVIEFWNVFTQSSKMLNKRLDW